MVEKSGKHFELCTIMLRLESVGNNHRFFVKK